MTIKTVWKSRKQSPFSEFWSICFFWTFLAGIKMLCSACNCWWNRIGWLPSPCKRSKLYRKAPVFEPFFLRCIRCQTLSSNSQNTGSRSNQQMNCWNSESFVFRFWPKLCKWDHFQYQKDQYSYKMWCYLAGVIFEAWSAIGKTSHIKSLCSCPDNPHDLWSKTTNPKRLFELSALMASTNSSPHKN